jgi:mono/diheme cytochrome c family protein
MRSGRFSAGLLITTLSIVASAIYGGVPDGQSGRNYSKDQISRGEYLVSAGGCEDCHTPKRFGARGPEPDTARHLSGAPAAIGLPAIPEGVLGPKGWGVLGSNDMTAWAGPWGVSFAANLTPDKTTGMGNWTEASFVMAMRTGKHKGLLRDILPPMPWQSMARLNDDDLRAVFAYLRSIRPINNKVPDPIPPRR